MLGYPPILAIRGVDLILELPVFARGQHEARQFQDFARGEGFRDGHGAHAPTLDEDNGWQSGPVDDPHDVLLNLRNDSASQTRPNEQPYLALPGARFRYLSVIF